MPNFIVVTVPSLTFEMDDFMVTVKSYQLWDGDIIRTMIDNDAALVVGSDDNLSDLMVTRRVAVHNAIRDGYYATVCCIDPHNATGLNVIDVQIATL